MKNYIDERLPGLQIGGKTNTFRRESNVGRDESGSGNSPLQNKSANSGLGRGRGRGAGGRGAGRGG